MENKDLGSKKMNNKQVNEGFSGENMSEEKNPSTPILKTEVEIDVNGNPIVVQRARNIDVASAKTPEEVDKDWNENESLSRGVTTEKEVDKTIENKDRNSDITPNRYPNSNPDNHENRGNIKLDEK